MAKSRKKKPTKYPKGLEDFRNFLFLCWIFLKLPEPTKRQYEIAQWLQTGPKRAIIQAFRGIGKSWITAAFVVWLLLGDPTLNIMVVSASKARADMFSTFCLQLIKTMPELRHLTPRRDQRDSKIAFDVGPAPTAQAPSCYSVSITGQMTGGRADVIIADDVEIPNNSATHEAREKLSERVKEFSAILKPGDTQRIIYLGTPQCEDSLYNHLLERGFVTRIWTARYPNEELLLLYGDRLAPSIRKELDEDPSLMVSPGMSVYGQPTDPVRFDEEDLQEREAEYGRSGFTLQFMLNSQLSDLERYPLKLSDLMFTGLLNDVTHEKPLWGTSKEHEITDVSPVSFRGDVPRRPVKMLGEVVPYQRSVLVIDPSGRGADETAYCVLKTVNGYVYCLDFGGVRGGYEDATLVELSKIAHKYKVNTVLIESNFGDGMFQQLLKPILHKFHNCAIEEYRATKQKEVRIIETLEPVMNQHKLVFDIKLLKKDQLHIEGVAPDKQQQYMLFYQMTRITRERGALAHDDRLDALAMGVEFLKDDLGLDVDRMMALREQQEWEKMVESMLLEQNACKSSNYSWIKR